LVVLRVREPELARPFKAGNLAVACALGAGPAVLIGYALWVSRTEQVKLGSAGVSALLFSLVVALMGPVLYRFARPKARELAAEAAD